MLSLVLSFASRPPTPFGRYIADGWPFTHQARALSVNGPSWPFFSKRARMRCSSCWRFGSGSETT